MGKWRSRKQTRKRRKDIPKKRGLRTKSKRYAAYADWMRIFLRERWCRWEFWKGYGKGPSKFQHENGLEEDGLYGNASKEKLENAYISKTKMEITEYKIGSTYILQANMKVREGAGTKYREKKTQWTYRGWKKSWCRRRRLPGQRYKGNVQRGKKSRRWYMDLHPIWLDCSGLQRESICKIKESRSNV